MLLAMVVDTDCLKQMLAQTLQHTYLDNVKTHLDIRIRCSKASWNSTSSSFAPWLS